jgi:tetratricopeptide (TPR) repeat protein
MLVALVVWLQVAGAPTPAALCSDLHGEERANRWERAKTPTLRRYCDLLAGGSAKLVGAHPAAEDALRMAEEAQALEPDAAAPLLLQGRALERLGRLDEAFTSMSEAQRRDPRALDDPLALTTWARLLSKRKDSAGALVAYRALLPRSGALPAGERAAVAIEAGFVAMSRGPSQLAEAVAMLRQGRRDGQDALRELATLGLALALDRMGERDEAFALVRDFSPPAPRETVSDPRVRELLTLASATSEESALCAIALESRAPALARDEWRRYVEKEGVAVWVDHARGHLAGAGGHAKRSP